MEDRPDNAEEATVEGGEEVEVRPNEQNVLDHDGVDRRAAPRRANTVFQNLAEIA